VTPDDSHPILGGASFSIAGLEETTSHRGKRKKSEDDDGDLEEGHAPPPPPSGSHPERSMNVDWFEWASTALSAKPSIAEMASEGNWLMATIGEDDDAPPPPPGGSHPKRSMNVDRFEWVSIAPSTEPSIAETASEGDWLMAAIGEDDSAPPPPPGGSCPECLMNVDRFEWASTAPSIEPSVAEMASEGDWLMATIGEDKADGEDDGSEPQLSANDSFSRDGAYIADGEYCEFKSSLSTVGVCVGIGSSALGQP
jgi:hypothetical protein